MQELEKIILKQIQEKKQIQNLDEKYIKDKIKKYFLKNGDKFKKLKKEFEKIKIKNKIIKNRLFKEIIKEIKKEIGVVYGSFLTKNFKKKEKLLEKEIENNKNDDKNENNGIGNNISKINELLILHKSSRERYEFYDEIYTKIFAWKRPKKIGDLACGLNPLSYFYMKNILNDDLEYFASDLNPADMKFLNLFFNYYNIKGKAKDYDLTSLAILKDENLKNCDMVLLFKALDSLEYIKKNISKDLLFGLNVKNIVVSFPTKSLVSKQNFKIEKRNWFIKFIKEQNWKYKTFEIENELFFLIEK